MNTALKKSLQVVLFVAIFVASYLYMGFVLTPKNINDKSSEKYFQSTALYKEEKNTRVFYNISQFIERFLKSFLIHS